MDITKQVGGSGQIAKVRFFDLKGKKNMDFFTFEVKISIILSKDTRNSC